MYYGWPHMLGQSDLIMSKTLLRKVPEVFLSTAEISHLVSRAQKARVIRKIGPRLYTKNLSDPASVIVSRNMWQIVGLLFPESIISHRTAIEGGLAADGSCFLTGPYLRHCKLPGLVIRQTPGPGPTQFDVKLKQGNYLSSPVRRLLENLQDSRGRLGVAKALGAERVSAKFEEHFHSKGPKAIDAIMKEASLIAATLGMEEEFARLTEIKLRFDSLISSPDYLNNLPFDHGRLNLFQELFEGLQKFCWSPSQVDYSLDEIQSVNLLDAYLSNFMEGVEFTFGEAKKIILRKIEPINRLDDAKLLSRYFDLLTVEYEPISHDFFDFLDNLRSTHAVLMGSKEAISPGTFKIRNNQASRIVFVEPGKVLGTLYRGCQLYHRLDHPAARAVFMHFMLLEIHPFNDGNGRMARLIANRELAGHNWPRIILGTRFSPRYYDTLRRMSEGKDKKVNGYIEYMDDLFSAVGQIDFGDLNSAREVFG